MADPLVLLNMPRAVLIPLEDAKAVFAILTKYPLAEVELSYSSRPTGYKTASTATPVSIESIHPATLAELNMAD
jgi:hypothetical protein